MLKHGEWRQVSSSPHSFTEFRFFLLVDEFCGAGVWELGLLREKPSGFALRRDPAGSFPSAPTSDFWHEGCIPLTIARKDVPFPGSPCSSASSSHHPSVQTRMPTSFLHSETEFPWLQNFPGAYLPFLCIRDSSSISNSSA